MADTIRKATYCYAEVPDNPGEGARILSALKEAGVNLLAFSGFPIPGGKAQLDFLPEDPEAFAKAASGLDLKFSERKNAFLIQGDDRVGAAFGTLAKLSEQGINVVSNHGVVSGQGRWGMILWVNPVDYERTSKVLGV